MSPINSSGDGPEILDTGADGRTGGGGARPWVAGAVLVALIGVVVGYAAGHRRSPAGPGQPHATATAGTAAPASQPSASESVVTGPAFVQTGVTCSVQRGRRLELGVQVENRSASVARIIQVRSREPLGGVRALRSGVGTCGQISQQPAWFDSSAVRPGAATWVSVSVEVLVRCPGADPVGLTVRYRRGSHTGAERLAGFVDLGNVPYSGCGRPH